MRKFILSLATLWPWGNSARAANAQLGAFWRVLGAIFTPYAERYLALGAQGHLSYFGLARETTWGTPVAPTDYMEIMRESLALTTDRFDVKNVINAFYEPDDVDGVDRIAGDVVVMGHPVSIGHFLKAAMNTVTGTSVLSGFLYTTRFVSTKSEFAAGVARQPYTLEVHRDVTSAAQYAGACLNQLQLSLAPNQDFRVTASWIAKALLYKASGSPTFPSSSQNPFTFDTASISLAGAATARIEALNITVDNQLEGITALNNSTQIARIKARGPQLIRVSGTIDFQDITEHLDFLNQTERALVLSLTKADSFQIVADFPRLVYTAFAPAIAGRERLTVQFAGTARYKVSSAVAAEFRLTSTVSNY